MQSPNSCTRDGFMTRFLLVAGKKSTPSRFQCKQRDAGLDSRAEPFHQDDRGAGLYPLVATQPESAGRYRNRPAALPDRNSAVKGPWTRPGRGPCSIDRGPPPRRIRSKGLLSGMAGNRQGIGEVYALYCILLFVIKSLDIIMCDSTQCGSWCRWMHESLGCPLLFRLPGDLHLLRLNAVDGERRQGIADRGGALSSRPLPPRATSGRGFGKEDSSEAVVRKHVSKLLVGAKAARLLARAAVACILLGLPWGPSRTRRRTNC